MYGSDPFAYDLDAALAGAGPREAPDARPADTDERAYWRRVPGRTPTVAELEKHAARFGDDCVLETAEEYGLVVALAGSRSRRRPTSDALREQVRALRERGLVPAAIADALQLSDVRVRRLLRNA